MSLSRLRMFWSVADAGAPPRPRAALRCAMNFTFASFLLAFPPAAQGQDRAGILGGGLAYVGIGGGPSGIGLQLEVASNINRVASLVQYRIHFTYSEFSADGKPPCGPEVSPPCAIGSVGHSQFSIEWHLLSPSGELARYASGWPPWVRAYTSEMSGREWRCRSHVT